MSRTDYDIVVVGGGLGGAAFAVVMAKAGARVLVVERETRFQDRIRGEFMESWGVAETRLGIYDALRGAANDNRYWQIYLGEMKLDPRDCVATTPRFVSEALRSGVPQKYYKGARASGPLASFISADSLGRNSLLRWRGLDW